MFFDLRNSLAEMEAVKREIDNVFNRSGYLKNNKAFPLVNVYDNNDELSVVAELPGLTSDNINITLTENVLHLSGNREEKNYGEKVSTLRKERSYGKFEKSLRLPFPVERDNITASFTDGVLTVKLPKAEEAKPKKVIIQA
jgi:HSP20 family protein